MARLKRVAMFDGPRVSHAVVAEWLRRLTRNQFRSAGVGSNPTDREVFLYCFFVFLPILRRPSLDSGQVSQSEHTWNQFISTSPLCSVIFVIGIRSVAVRILYRAGIHLIRDGTLSW